jgi:Raf kinase inhibitor-like YbhB/YbcL family protein
MADATPFTLTSTAFDDGGDLPSRFTCDGDDVCPDLFWRDAPGPTGAFVLILDDPDAHGFVHWLVYDMTGSGSGGLPEAISATPDAPLQGLNDFGRIGYGGPCPPSGSHQYRFTLYALDEMLDIAGQPRSQEVRDAMAGHILDTAVLTGTYGRG